MLELEGLNFRYTSSKSPSLRVDSLEVEEQGAVLVCGLTGSGKTTMLRCMNGLIPHYYGGQMHGHVLIDGLDTRSHTPGEISSVVGTLFQDPENQFLMLTAGEEIAFSLRNEEFDEHEVHARVEETAELLGISELLERNIFELSSGEKQKLAVASIVSAGQKYLILDEPTSQLDNPSARSMVEMLRNLAAERSILITEHRIERVQGMCSRFLVMEGGMVVRDGDRYCVKEWMEEKGLTSRAEQMHAQGGEELLSAEGITVSFDERRVLDGVSLSLKSGEMTMLVGHNGSGKTTLLKSIMNFLPKEGRVNCIGRDISSLPPPEIARDVAYLSHTPLNYLFQPSLKEEILFTLKNLGDGKTADLQEALATASILGLGDKIDDFPREFSCGERELAAIASVVAGSRRCLLLDEPTRGMDYLRKRNFMLRLRALCSRGSAVLMATHDFDLVRQYADRVYMMNNGRCTELKPGQLGEDQV